jgi:hypothetical protein
LTSLDRRENFLLDVNRRSIRLERVTYQTRARVTVILARLDLGGSGHRNPDDTEISAPHLHLFREGFGVKWAFEVPINHFTHLDDRWLTFQDFMAFIRVEVAPDVIWDLAS